MLESLWDTYLRLLEAIPHDHSRYLFEEFHIQDRLTGLIGARGVGKTTLLLQFIKKNYADPREVFYCSADNLYFNQNTLFETVEKLYQMNHIRVFFFDEIHKYRNWSQELKNLYDSFPGIKIIFSGSSSLDLIKGSHDLTRRGTLFYLKGLSFREYLNFSQSLSLPKISFEDVTNFSKPLLDIAKIPKLLGHFKEYMQYGYYPFILEGNVDAYYDKISRVIDKTIYEDIANFYALKTENLHLFKKILNFAASIPPGDLNPNTLAKNLGVDNKTVIHYLTILQETGLVRFVAYKESGGKTLRQSAKLFLENTTLQSCINYFLGSTLQVGTQRELFFLQMTQNAKIKVFCSKVGDYQIDHHLFEIGGNHKKHKQLKGSDLRGFVVKDNTLLTGKYEIPLYAFGFLY